MKKILPIEEIPPITSYSGMAIIFSILWAHKSELLPWLSDHYIQLIASHNTIDWFVNFCEGINNNGISSALYCPLLEVQNINKKAIDKFVDNFAEFIENQIDNDFYVSTWLNHFYLSCSQYYSQADFMHIAFINGYDKDKNEIMLSDFFNNERFNSKIVSYDEINRSYLRDHFRPNEHKKFYAIYLYKYVEANYKINMDLLRLSLSDYLESKDSFLRFNSTDDRQMQYGLGVYDSIIEHCMMRQEKTSLLDTRAFHVLADHKVAMKFRLEYLIENELISKQKCDSIYQQCGVLRDQSIVLRNKVIKYNIKKDEELLCDIVNKCLDLKKADREQMISIYESI